MSDPENIYVSFLWEDHNCLPAVLLEKGFDSFQDAVDFGVGNLALFFTVEGENAGRHYTNVREIKSAAQTIEYLQRTSALHIEQKVLSRMFSRVSEDPRVQSEYSKVRSFQDAIDVLLKEPSSAQFLTPSNGGYIKLEPSDKAYDWQGQQIWPLKTQPKQSPRPAKHWRF